MLGMVLQARETLVPDRKRALQMSMFLSGYQKSFNFPFVLTSCRKGTGVREHMNSLTGEVKQVALQRY